MSLPEPSTPDTPSASTRDPYAPPAAPLTAAAGNLLDEHDEAGRWKRFFCFLLDYAGVMGFVYAAAYVLGVLSPVFDWADAAVTFVIHANALEDRLIGTGGYFVYYLFWESLFAATPAKWILGTRVVSASGERPSFAKVIVRSLARLVPFEPLVYALAGTAWHDSWSGTVVVDIRSKASTRLSPQLRKFYR